MQLEGIDHVALAVRDVERSAQWYVEVLGFERRYGGMWNGIPTFIGKGATAIALFPIRDRDSRPAARAVEIGMLHLAFRADRKNFLIAQDELKGRGINSNSRITKSRTRSTFAIPIATNSKSPLTS